MAVWRREQMKKTKTLKIQTKTINSLGISKEEKNKRIFCLLDAEVECLK